MTADPRDDFSIFAESAHMFFGLEDPYRLVREEIADALTRQVPNTTVDAIVCYGEPKWLTLGRKQDDDPQHLIVGHYAVCFRCQVEVTTPRRPENLEATVTLLFCDIDKPGEERMRLSMDIHRDADDAYRDDVFERRFLEFRNETP